MTPEELTDKVLQRLSMVDGLDAQIYAEPRIILALQYRFDTLFDDYWWPHYTTRDELFTLGDDTGLITGTLEGKITQSRFKDLRSVRWEDDDNPLPMAPDNMNLNNITAPCIVPYLADPDKMFKVYPVTTSGDVHVTYRTYPDYNDPDWNCLLDHQLMILGTCYDVLEADSINPVDASKFERMFDKRLLQETKNLNNIPKSSGRVNRTFPLNRWT